ncbi:MAG: hypothetical protein E7585_07490 [Ruminococcaceae bacterium]|nr:hypothetical protein [Oscillospiraceae bacterium]
MKENKKWALLRLFGEVAEGGSELSDPTPQTDTGDMQASAPAAGETDEAKERQERFRVLMEGEYKDLFTAYFQETFNRRFREQKEMKEAFEKNRATLQAAASYLGVAEEDLPHYIEEELKRKATREAKEQPTLERAGLRDEIARSVAAALAAAREEMEQQIVNAIRARGLRPSESALSDGGGDALYRRAGSLSRAQRAELARRAALGEEIKL